jgi:hypothetical protein
MLQFGSPLLSFVLSGVDVLVVIFAFIYLQVYNTISISDDVCVVKFSNKKGVKSESVNRRTTDKAITKRKRRKGQNITQNTRNRTTQTTLKQRCEIVCSGMVAVSAPHVVVVC